MIRVLLGTIGSLLLTSGLSAQTAITPTARRHFEGDWVAKSDEGIRHIMVRHDSSAQFGDQVARWRIVRDSLWLTLGDGVWMVYGLKVEKEKVTLSGGDLKKSVTLHRTGPATARPDTVAIPAPPPDKERAWD